MAIRAAGDNCVLVTKTDDSSEQYIMILCNAIGTPVDSKYTEVEPLVIAMTKYCIVCASEDYVYVWQFKATISDEVKGL
jgi:WD repeat-containing protein 35